MKESILLFLTTIVVYVLCILVLGLPFMWLWNWIAPIFWAAAPALTYGQSVGTLLLLLFLRPSTYINGKNK